MADSGKCGACYGHLPPHHTPVDVVELSRLNRLIAQVRVPVLVDLRPVTKPDRLMIVAANLAGRVLVVRLLTDAAAEMDSRYPLEQPPRFLLFQRGRLLRQQGDLFDPAALEHWALTSA